MEIALSILIPVCVTALIITKWIVRPKIDDRQLRYIEIKALTWMSENYSVDRETKARKMMAYFNKWYPDAEKGAG